MKKHHLYTIDSKDLNAKIAGIIEQTSILGPVTSDKPASLISILGPVTSAKLASLISVLVKKHVDHAVSCALELDMTPEDTTIAIKIAEGWRNDLL